MYIKEEERSRGGPRTGWRSYDQTTNSVGTTAGQHGQEGRSATREGDRRKRQGGDRRKRRGEGEGEKEREEKERKERREAATEGRRQAELPSRAEAGGTAQLASACSVVAAARTAPGTRDGTRAPRRLTTALAFSRWRTMPRVS